MQSLFYLKKSSIKSPRLFLIKKLNHLQKLSILQKKRNLKLIDISKTFKKIDITSKVASEFKKRNLSMAIEAVKLCGLKEKKIFRTLKNLKDVNGRLELAREFPNNIKVFIDYAHTPDALLKTLLSLKKDYGNNISLVFGCGGDRDKKEKTLNGQDCK